MSSTHLPGNRSDDFAARTADTIHRVMPRNETLKRDIFGKRLRRFRLERSLTQQELGDMLGISKRMVAYYELDGGTPAAELLSRAAHVLGVSLTDLVGEEKAGKAGKPALPQSGPEHRMWRKFCRVKSLPTQDQRMVFKFIDTLLKQHGV